MPQTNRAHFDIQRDIEVVRAGGLFCRACLIGKPASEASPDSRNCQGCYDFLGQEAALLTGTTRPKWIPRPELEKRAKNLIPVAGDGDGIMSTVEDKKITVDIIRPSVTPATAKRGPKYRQLPEDLITSLADKGMGSKSIASTLKADYGIGLSYKTVQRVLSGERQQAELMQLQLKPGGGEN